ncbi:STAS domain-containing protein [Streptomyces sp. NBC_00454]|uniref:STAS domain-containing protein n=1 Tax=Streptomyces sp. NBC_00454 TaxID=2975747 RepID=UPI0030E399BA
MPAYLHGASSTPADPGTTVSEPSAVSVVFEPNPLRVLARVSGEIDMEYASALREDLAPALTSSRHGLDLDLSGVTFCDSSGLHLLLDLDRMASDTGKNLVLTALSHCIARLLEITGTRSVFTIRDGKDPAGSRETTGISD